MNRKGTFLLGAIILMVMSNVVVNQKVEITVLYDLNSKTIEYNGEFYEMKNLIGKIKSADENFENHQMLLEVSESSNPAWFNLSVVLFLTVFAGAMSGLTVGYLSIDDLVLELRSKTGTDQEQHYARRILPILNKRHWLLVTLLLWNATAMEALPIFLNKLVDEFMAIVISVTLVLFVGEIVPQALCTGPGQLGIASFLAPLVNFLMWISFPISYPIALILDYLLGKHGKSRFLNTDLKGLIELHTMEALERLHKEQGQEIAINTESNEIGLRMEQADLMISALEIKQRKASEIMIGIENIFMLDYDTVLDEPLLEQVLDKGYSRIPVYLKDKHNVLGILRIKQLVGVDLSNKKSIKQLGIKLSPPIVVHPETPALDLLQEFRNGKSHMAFVTANVEEYRKKFEEEGVNTVNSLLRLRRSSTKGEKILGMVTLEDLLEKMINIEILDEDEYARTKTMHEKRGVSKKSKFYKDAITRELAASFVDENKEKIGSMLAKSYKSGKLGGILMQDPLSEKDDLNELLLNK